MPIGEQQEQVILILINIAELVPVLVKINFSTVMEDKEKKNVYNFNSLDTMRYQGYYLEITNGIPNTLYCEFYENY